MPIPGGWQFSYRYGMILLPWMFLILLANGKDKISKLEAVLFMLSVVIRIFPRDLSVSLDGLRQAVSGFGFRVSGFGFNRSQVSSLVLARDDRAERRGD